MDILNFENFNTLNESSNMNIIEKILAHTSTFKNVNGHVHYYFREMMLIGTVNGQPLYANDANQGSYYDLNGNYHDSLTIGVLYNPHYDKRFEYNKYDQYFITKEDIEMGKSKFADYSTNEHKMFEVDLKIDADIFEKIYAEITNPECIALNKKLVQLYNLNNSLRFNKVDMTLDIYKKIKEYNYLHDLLSNGVNDSYAAKDWFECKDWTDADYKTYRDEQDRLRPIQNKMAMDILNEILAEEKAEAEKLKNEK